MGDPAGLCVTFCVLLLTYVDFIGQSNLVNQEHFQSTSMKV